MTRDNVLFIVVGVLLGFIAGYLMQEVMAERQPPRLVHGQDGPVAAPDGGAPGAPAGTGAGPAAGAGTGPGAELEARLQEIRSLEAHLASSPDDADALLRLASLSFDVESWSRCVESYERYLELRPATADVLSDMGVCYRGVGQLDRALELFDRAHEIEPGHWQSRFNQVVVLAFDRRDYDAAEEVLQELEAMQPQNPAVERLAEEVARRRSAA